jgi:hypothetical protein
MAKKNSTKPTEVKPDDSSAVAASGNPEIVDQSNPPSDEHSAQAGSDSDPVGGGDSSDGGNSVSRDVEPVTPSDGTLSVKNAKGVIFTVSPKYYQAYKHKLELVE